MSSRMTRERGGEEKEERERERGGVLCWEEVVGDVRIWLESGVRRRRDTGEKEREEKLVVCSG